MLSILFIHEYFPAQFGGLAHHLAEQGHRVVFACAREEAPPARQLTSENLRVFRYPGGTSPRVGHPYLAMSERAVRNGQSFAREAKALMSEGFAPNIIFTHSGWAAGMFAKTLWPQARLVQYLEWWFNAPPLYQIPDTKPSAKKDEDARSLANNLSFLNDFQCAEMVISPTAFQAGQSPDFVRPLIEVEHDGIDCDLFRPRLPDEPPLPIHGVSDDAQLVTFTSRSLEPVRGFYDWMAAAEKLMARNPDLHVAIGGEDRARYGPKMRRGQGHKNRMLARHKLDRDRIHFLGRPTEHEYIRLLQRSNVHLNLSYPFIPARSFFEAMACACPLVSTNIPSVIEGLGESEPALLVDPGDVNQIVASVEVLLGNPDEAKAMGAEARWRAKTAFSTEVCHPKIEKLLADLYARPRTSEIAAQ